MGCSRAPDPLPSQVTPVPEEGAAWIADPSQEPLQKFDRRSGERVRILADFNGNGIIDMALSCDRSLFGNAGGVFTLYVGNDTGRYRKHGEFFAHPNALAIEKVREKVRLWTYLRGGGWIGQIGYHEVNENGLSGFQSITIHPGDGGSKIGNAISQSVFSNSDIPIIVEHSRTRDGVVEWFAP